MEHTETQMANPDPIWVKETKKGPITDKMRKALKEPFPKEAYGAVGSKTYLTSIKAMYIIERLNDVFGIGRWEVKTKVVSLTPPTEKEKGYVLMEGVFHSLDYDVVISKQYGGHVTTGKGTELADGFKSAVTDVTTKLASALEIAVEVFKGNVDAKGTNTIEEAKKAAEKAKLIQPDTLKRIGEILIKDGAKTKELAQKILFEKYGVPHTKDVKKFTKMEGKKLLAKMLNPKTTPNKEEDGK